MSVKHRKIKGRIKIEARKVSKSSRKRIDFPERMLATALYLIEEYTKQQTAERTELKPFIVQRIAARARNRADDLRISLLDRINFQNRNENIKAFKKLIKEKKDELCDYVISSRENRDKETIQHIIDLELNISDSTFKQIMYDKDYCRRKHD